MVLFQYVVIGGSYVIPSYFCETQFVNYLCNVFCKCDFDAAVSYSLKGALSCLKYVLCS